MNRVIPQTFEVARFGVFLMRINGSMLVSCDLSWIFTLEIV